MKTKPKYPSKEECLELLQEYETPEHVKLHCIAVSMVAESIANVLNDCGLNLNIELILAAGLLHDIARVHSKHEKVGADYLTSIGLEEVGEIIRNHTFHRIVNKKYNINEEDVLCIADRLVLENKYVGPQKRMDYVITKAIKKFGEEKSEELHLWVQSFIDYIDELEIFIGKKIIDIVPDSVK